MSKNNEDGAWKELLHLFFKDFVDFCFPRLSKQIDWSKSFQSLDKELHAITSTIDVGVCVADNLFKVYLKNGQERWILIHVEVQGRPHQDFPKRMFTYHYRIFDKYQRSVMSCAILTDTNKNWRPNFYKVGTGGSYLSSKFLVVKIIDYESRLNELEASNNIFACVIYTQLMALKAKLKPGVERKNIKFELTRRLYDKGFDKKIIQGLFKFLDWSMGLPAPLDIQYEHEIFKYEESKKMAYVTSIERHGIEKGMKEGILKGKAEGIEEEKLVIAQRLIAMGIDDIEFIAEATELESETIKKLKRGKKVH